MTKMNIPKLKNPFGGKWPITQEFGENPNWYKKWGMIGHNGVDFGLPVGEQINAVFDGRVIKTGFDKEGYGNYIRIQHNFGETIYAHLSHIWVPVNNSISAGHGIGRSGNTGFSTGPHLHLGLRPKDFDKNNGYLGYIDPLPYFPDFAPSSPVTSKFKCPACSAGLEVFA